LVGAGFSLNINIEKTRGGGGMSHCSWAPCENIIMADFFYV